MKRLRSFTSVQVPDELFEAFSALEDLLQQEHDSGGQHQRASSSQDGFMSAEDKRRLEEMWNRMKTENSDAG